MNILHPLILAALVGLSLAQCNLQSVCYALDESGSISLAEFETAKKFTVSTARILAKQNPSTSFSGVGFTAFSRVIQTPTGVNAFVKTIDGTSKTSGGTNIFAGLRECLAQFSGKPTGARLIILLTDGQGDSGPDPRPKIKAQNIGLLAVGVGSGVDEDFLKATASKPRFFLPTTFDKLPNLDTGAAGAACDLITDIMKPKPNPPKPAPAPAPAPMPTGNSCHAAFKKCAWKFRGVKGVPTFRIEGRPNQPFSPAIVAKYMKNGNRLGVLNGNIVPEFITSAGARRMTKFGKQPFTSSAFKPFSRKGRSFMGRENFHGNQLQVAKGKCVRVFFRSFHVVNKHGVVIRNVNNVPKSKNKCVVFRVAK